MQFIVRGAASTGLNGSATAAVHDVAVIGGGVVGCAVARTLTLRGARVILLEKASDILAGASKANSALLHTGFDAPSGSLELQLMQQGYAEYLAVREPLNLPLLQTGALVAAWSEDDSLRLDAVEAQARANGVDDVRRLDRREALAREPGLSPAIQAALWVPGEHVIDAWSAPLAYLTQAVANGAHALFGAEVLAGDFNGERWILVTSRGPVTASAVVNCAGLYGDVVEQRLLGDASFEIRPRKGQFVVLDKAAARHVGAIILPVPNDRTKGVVVTRTVYGNVLIGPTAEEQPERDRATVDRDALSALVRRGAEIIPALAGAEVTAVYAGLRPASDSKAYRIRSEPARNWLTLGGVRSTGLTAALGLSHYAADVLASDGSGWSPLAVPIVTPVPNLAEHLPRDWRNPGYGEIVCHCEMVTRREIEAAFASALPPGDFGGLKRRTRAAMGRCQGFYCGARLAALTEGRFAAPLALASA